LAAFFASLSAEIMTGFTSTVAAAGPAPPDTQSARREFVRRVIALDPVVDEAIGESAQRRYHSPVLQRAVDGLFTVLLSRRAVANHLVRLPDNQARQGCSSERKQPRTRRHRRYQANLRDDECQRLRVVE
jgi:hypothetical protein